MTETNKPPIWYWIATGFFLLWNGIGVKQYFMYKNNPEAVEAQYTGAALEAYLATPTWVMRAYAVAVICGFLASILLMARRRFAYPMALTSLIAVIAQMGYLFFVVKPANLFLPITIVVCGVLLLLFSKLSKSKAWLV